MLETGEVILILLVALIFFGPSRLPKSARTLGVSIPTFSKAQRGIESVRERRKKMRGEIEEMGMEKWQNLIMTR